MTVIKTTLKNRSGSTTEWLASSRILLLGELGYDYTLNEFRMGNGSELWSQLDVYIDKDEIAAMIADAIDGIAPGGGDNSQALQNHIDSETPHPVYDNMPALDLIYENAKV